ncbi:expressed hypothetical protein [Trichoplax adhaerens]|uniref:Saposin B-type domain-containing protein n=1 Tax=Trichoplax adhaerens TaxID=10228 RepID=B3SAS9_TRIAD|nr:expressed hypothetical protein [Trichoplax adhaerens]EDV20158.1 expressed hypothetical protein [Trichoplax adhaerens]|eukprot:XP_002117319.1 expressed hypothetical protein [Trichoplax adhaerens]
MASKLLTVFFIVACVSHLIYGENVPFGSESCTQGPSYWCQSFETAAKCGTSYLCMVHAWSKNQNGVSDDVFCSVCEKMVGDYLHSAKFKKNLNEFMVKFCNKQPKLLHSVCKHLAIHNLVPFIIHEINKMTPKDFCKLFNLCSKSLTEDELKSKLTANIMKHTLIGSKIWDDLASGDGKDLEFWDKIMKTLFPGAVKNTDSHSSLGNVKAGSTNSTACIVCSFAVGVIDSMLRQKSAENTVTHEIDHFCTYMPSDTSKECQSFANQYGPPILQALLQHVSPKKVCAYYLRACPQSKLDHGTSGMQTVAPTQLTSGYCVFCEVAVRVVEELHKINKTKKYIFGFWNKVCDTVGSKGTFGYECRLILQKLEKITHLIKNKITAPSHICQIMHACRKSAMAPMKMDVCRFGPRFWCSSDVAASMCKKQHYCRTEYNAN